MSRPVIKYFIVDSAIQPTDPAWVKAPQRPETARRSTDGKKIILKFKEGDIPESWGNGYSHEEILSIIADPEGIWYLPDLDPET